MAGFYFTEHDYERRRLDRETARVRELADNFEREFAAFLCSPAGLFEQYYAARQRFRSSIMPAREIPARRN
jgi:hypothetical protein